MTEKNAKTELRVAKILKDAPQREASVRSALATNRESLSLN